jgi:hypothetical protein
MESLAVLGKVQDTLDAVQNRLPIEIYALVDRTIAQVEERHLHSADSYPTKQRRSSVVNIFMYSLDKADSESQNEILKDFLWTLYSKLEAVLRGHRVLEDCARRIQAVCSRRSATCIRFTSNDFFLQRQKQKVAEEGITLIADDYVNFHLHHFQAQVQQENNSQYTTFMRYGNQCNQRLVSKYLIFHRFCMLT